MLYLGLIRQGLFCENVTYFESKQLLLERLTDFLPPLMESFNFSVAFYGIFWSLNWVYLYFCCMFTQQDLYEGYCLLF